MRAPVANRTVPSVPAAVAGPGALLLREAGLPERALAKLWRERARRLRTLDGKKLEVLYPGRPAPGHGPDFRDAIVRLDGERLHGDVEVHRRPAGWRQHGHHLDPAYEGVMLHVVGSGAGPPGPAVMPTVIVPPGTAAPPKEASGRPLAHLAALGPAGRRAALHEAGLAWFAERITQAAGVVDANGIEQALYVSIMEGLGYAENRAPFVDLAARLPYVVLAAVARSVDPGRVPLTFRDLLLGGSGLAPVTQVWVEYAGTLPLERERWRTAGVRPANHPRRRIDAAAALLSKHARTGLSRPFIVAVATGLWPPLIAALRVSGERPAGGGGKPPGGSLGAGRACLIAINGILPTLAAWGRVQCDDGLVRCCHSAFAGAPALPSNTMTREAASLAGIGPRERLGACEAQGLLRLYRAAVGT